MRGEERADQLCGRLRLACIKKSERARGLHQRTVGRVGARLFLFVARFFGALLADAYERAMITGDDMRRRVEPHEAVETAERAFVLAVEPVQHRLDEIDDRLVRRLSPELRHLCARL